MPAAKLVLFFPTPSPGLRSTGRGDGGDNVLRMELEDSARVLGFGSFRYDPESRLVAAKSSEINRLFFRIGGGSVDDMSWTSCPAGGEEESATSAPAKAVLLGLTAGVEGVGVRYICQLGSRS